MFLPFKVHYHGLCLAVHRQRNPRLLLDTEALTMMPYGLDFSVLWPRLSFPMAKTFLS